MRFSYLPAIMLSFSLILATDANADKWTIEHKVGRYFAVIPELDNARVELKTFGGHIPKPGDSTRLPPKSHQHLRIFSYFAGETGSTRIVSHYRSFIFDTKTGKSLGDFPSSYIVSTTPRAKQPIWTWKADHLIVKDGEFDGEWRIPLR